MMVLVFRQFLDKGSDLNDLGRIQANGRFVEDQNLRVSDQCLSQADSLAVAFGKIFDHPFPYAENADLFADPLYMLFFIAFRGFFQIIDEIKNILRPSCRDRAGAVPANSRWSASAFMGSLIMSYPFIVTVPSVAPMYPVRIFIVVDFPAPLRPSKPRT